eukprot:gene31298-6447_t
MSGVIQRVLSIQRMASRNRSQAGGGEEPEEGTNGNDSAFNKNARDDLSSIFLRTAMAAAAKSRAKSSSTLPNIGAAEAVKMWKSKSKRGGGGDGVQLGAASFVSPSANNSHSISSNGDSASLNLDYTSQKVDAMSMQMVASQVMSRLGLQAGNMDKEKKSYMNDNSAINARKLSHLGSGQNWASNPLASGGQQLLGQRTMARNSSLSGLGVSYSADLPGGHPHPFSAWQPLQLSKRLSITRQPKSAADRAIASIDAEADTEADAAAHRKRVVNFWGAKASGLSYTRKGRSRRMSMVKPNAEELDAEDEVRGVQASSFSYTRKGRSRKLSMVMVKPNDEELDVEDEVRGVQASSFSYTRKGRSRKLSMVVVKPNDEELDAEDEVRGVQASSFSYTRKGRSRKLSMVIVKPNDEELDAEDEVRGVQASSFSYTRKGRSRKLSMVMVKPNDEELDTEDEVQQMQALPVSTSSGVGRAGTETLFKLHASKVAQSSSQTSYTPLALNRHQSERGGSSKPADSAWPRPAAPKAKDSNAWNRVGALQDSGLAVDNVSNIIVSGGGSGIWNARTTGKAFSFSGLSPQATPPRNLREVEESRSGAGPSLLSRTFGSKRRISCSAARLAGNSPDDNLESVIEVIPSASLSIVSEGGGSQSSVVVEIRVPACLSLSKLRVDSPTGLSQESSDLMYLTAPKSPTRYSLKGSYSSGQVNFVAPARSFKSSLKPGFLKGSSKLGPQESSTGSSGPLRTTSSGPASASGSDLQKFTMRKAATATLTPPRRENSDPYFSDGSAEAQATALLAEIATVEHSKSVFPSRDPSSFGDDSLGKVLDKMNNSAGKQSLLGRDPSSFGNDSLGEVLEEMNKSAGKQSLPGEFCPRPNLDALIAQVDPSGSSASKPSLSRIFSQVWERNKAAGKHRLLAQNSPHPTLDNLLAQLDPSGSSAKRSVSELGSQGQYILKLHPPQSLKPPTPWTTPSDSLIAKPGGLPNSLVNTPPTFSDITVFQEPEEPRLQATTPSKRTPGQPLPTFTDIRDIAFNMAQDVTCLAGDMKAAYEGLQEMLRQTGELLAKRQGTLPSSVPHPQHASAASLPAVQHNWNPHAPMEDDSPGVSSNLSHSMRLSQSTIDMSNVFLNVPSERMMDNIAGSQGCRSSLSYSRKIADVERAIVDMDSDYAPLSIREVLHMDVTDVPPDMLSPRSDSTARPYSGKLSPWPDAAPRDGVVEPMTQNVNSISRRSIIPFASIRNRSSQPGVQAAAHVGMASMSFRLGASRRSSFIQHQSSQDSLQSADSQNNLDMLSSPCSTSVRRRSISTLGGLSSHSRSRKGFDASGNESFSMAANGRARRQSVLEATVSSLALFGTPVSGSEAIGMTEDRKPSRRSTLDEPTTSHVLHRLPNKKSSLKVLVDDPAHQHLYHRSDTSLRVLGASMDTPESSSGSFSTAGMSPSHHAPMSAISGRRRSTSYIAAPPPRSNLSFTSSRDVDARSLLPTRMPPQLSNRTGDTEESGDGTSQQTLYKLSPHHAAVSTVPSQGFRRVGSLSRKPPPLDGSLPMVEEASESGSQSILSGG